MKDLNGREIPQSEMDAYEVALKKWYEYMDSIKPKEEAYGFESGGLESQAGWCIEGGEDAYYKAMSEWEMKRSCDAPNRPGYYRANND